MRPSITLRSTVRCGNRLKRWKTMPISERSCASVPSPRGTSRPPCPSRTPNRRPSSRTSPLSTGSSRARQRRSVLFPDPEGPRIALTSPRWTPKETPRSTSVRPYRLRTSTDSRTYSAPDDAPAATASPRMAASSRWPTGSTFRPFWATSSFIALERAVGRVRSSTGRSFAAKSIRSGVRSATGSASGR